MAPHKEGQEKDIITWIPKQSRVFGAVASNHGNLYVMLLARCLGRYGVPHAEVKGTE